jgi:hypothetical protein
MARVAQQKVDTSGLYSVLAAQEEREFRDWLSVDRGRGRDAGDYPRRRILEALHDGRPVNVPRHSLPGWARLGAPARRGRLGLAVIYPGRAIVRPDDTITWSDDDWARLWLEENDL